MASRTSDVSAGRSAGRRLSAAAAASQTLMVLSLEPETMVLPSGEKATERTQLLCAFSFSALSSREAAAGRGAVSFGREGSGVSVPTHLHPRL